MGDMTRKEHINRLKAMQERIKHYVDPDCDNCEINYMPGNLGEIKETLAFAIASLETDEAYQLEYEQPEFCTNCIDREETLKAMDTWDKFGYTETGAFIRNPKNDDYILYVHYEDMVKCVKGMPSVLPKTTNMIDQSNFSKEQYKADLDTAYECGKASVLPKADKPKGRWTHISYFDGGFGINQRCSNCDHTMSGQIFDLVDNYCPNCGAKMEQGENI